MGRASPLLASIALSITVSFAAATGSAAAADDLVYRCGPNLCKVRPDGSGKRQLTRNGKAGGPAYAWVSASRDGSRLGVSFGNDAYILDGRGHRLGKKLPDSGGALPVVQISPNGRTAATIETVTQLQYPPPVGGIIGPPIPTLVPFLFLTDLGSRERTTVARSTVTTGWLGPRLMRSEPAGAEPFEQQVCLLASNTDFPCERLVATDSARNLWNPAGSPNARLVAASRAQDDQTSGPIAVFSSATGRLVRTLTKGPNDTLPSWSRDGKSIAFSRGRSIWTVPAAGGSARRVTKGVQPVWVPRR
jgi:WD40-like Beta Propeller Repeat